MTSYCATPGSLMLQYFECRESSGSCHHPAARMRCRTAKIKIPDRSSIPCPARYRPQKEQLVEGQFSLEDVSFSQTKFLIEIPRSDDLPVQNDVFQIRRVFTQCVDNVVAERFALFGPAAVLQVKRRILDEDRHHVFSGRGHRWIEERRNNNIEVRPPRISAVFCFVVRALNVIDCRTDRNGSGKMRARSGKGGEFGKRIQRQIDLPRRSPDFEISHLVEKLTIEALRIDED